MYIAIFCHGTSLKKKHLATWGLESAHNEFASPVSVVNKIKMLCYAIPNITQHTEHFLSSSSIVILSCTINFAVDGTKEMKAKEADEQCKLI